MADINTLRVIVVTPERAELDTPAEFVVLPLFDGERGIQRGHSAFVGQLGAGELRITTGTETRRYFVDAGFVQVAGGTVNVLTAKAVPADKVTADAATAARAAADALPGVTTVERETRAKAVARAQGLAAVARRNG